MKEIELANYMYIFFLN